MLHLPVPGSERFPPGGIEPVAELLGGGIAAELQEDLVTWDGRVGEVVMHFGALEAYGPILDVERPPRPKGLLGEREGVQVSCRYQPKPGDELGGAVCHPQRIQALPVQDDESPGAGSAPAASAMPPGGVFPAVSDLNPQVQDLWHDDVEPGYVPAAVPVFNAIGGALDGDVMEVTQPPEQGLLGRVQRDAIDGDLHGIILARKVIT